MSLLKALATVSSMTFVSRILGFIRDVLIARLFGAGLATDAFFVAFRIPNLLRRLFAEGAFSQAFVPVLSEYRTRRGDAETRLLVDRTATLLTLALLAATALGVAAAPAIIYVSAPGFAATPAKFDLTVAMLRITFPYILFISLVSLAGGILNNGSLTLDHVVVTGNTMATNAGDFWQGGGGVYNGAGATFNLIDSSVTNQSAWLTMPAQARTFSRTDLSIKLRQLQ